MKDSKTGSLHNHESDCFCFVRGRLVLRKREGVEGF